jgi:hypothetical protein
MPFLSISMCETKYDWWSTQSWDDDNFSRISPSTWPFGPSGRYELRSFPGNLIDFISAAHDSPCHDAGIVLHDLKLTNDEVLDDQRWIFDGWRPWPAGMLDSHRPQNGKHCQTKSRAPQTHSSDCAHRWRFWDATILRIVLLLVETQFLAFAHRIRISEVFQCFLPERDY